jgi:hypothetical protein
MKWLIPLVLVLAAPCFAQTRPDVRQLKGPSRDPIAIVVVLLNGKPVLASLGSGLELDTTVSPPVLRAVSSQIRAVRLSRAPDGSWTIPSSCSSIVAVYRNGLRQWEGEDYSTAGTALRFRSGSDNADPSLADDVIVCDCR